MRPDEWNNSTVREVEHGSILDFLLRHQAHFHGRVLDFGAGKQPYRLVVEAATAIYVPFDRRDHPASILEEDIGPDEWMWEKWDGILCTQVLQYVTDVAELLFLFRHALADEGRLVLTYSTCWDEVEPADLHRFTYSGIERLLKLAGFEVLVHERRAEVELGGFKFPLGGGVVAW